VADKALPPEDAPTLRYDPEIGPGYFVQTRTDFLRNPAHSPMFTRLYQVLLTYCGAGETAFPGQVRLARECAISERSVRNVMDELEAAGLVTVTRRGLNLTNMYYVHKLPLIGELTEDRHQMPIKNGTSRRPKTAAVATKKESDQIQTVETDRPTLRNVRHEGAVNILRKTLRDRGWGEGTIAQAIESYRDAEYPPVTDWLAKL
jgi:hypothetical protein